MSVQRPESTGSTGFLSRLSRLIPRRPQTLVAPVAPAPAPEAELDNSRFIEVARQLGIDLERLPEEDRPLIGMLDDATRIIKVNVPSGLSTIRPTQPDAAAEAFRMTAARLVFTLGCIRINLADASNLRSNLEVMTSHPDFEKLTSPDTLAQLRRYAAAS